MTKGYKILAFAAVMMISLSVSASNAQADHYKSNRHYDSRACKESFRGSVNNLYGQVCIQKNGDVKLTRQIGHITHTHVYDASLFDNGKHDHGKHSKHKHRKGYKSKHASIKRDDRHTNHKHKVHRTTYSKTVYQHTPYFYSTGGNGLHFSFNFD